MYGQVTSAFLNIRGPSKKVNPWDASSFDSSTMECILDVEHEEPQLDILCMQVSKELFWGQGVEVKICCLLLKPTKTENEYQRIGIALIGEDSRELVEGWERREITII
jgi:hypothetical protein